TKHRSELTLKDILSRLTYRAACKLLGPDGERLIRQGGKFDITNIDTQVIFDNEIFRLDLGFGEVFASISLADNARQRLHLQCSVCTSACEHVGAALALILEEKIALGLAKPPPERKPVASLSDEELLVKALQDRQERAKKEKMILKSMDPTTIWTDYTVTNTESGKTHRVAIRGWNPGESYCSCPDFRKNTLGTCKHILNVLGKLKQRFPAAVCKQPYQRKNISVHMHYGKNLELRLLLPEKIDQEIAKIVQPVQNKSIHDIHMLLSCVNKLEASGYKVNIYPDAEEYIQYQLQQRRLEGLINNIRNNPAAHPLRKKLLKFELLPYQMDGIAFAVGAGRAILADDMGLGKTIQGVGVAELLAQQAGIKKVLIICPTSLKSQWCNEIHRFANRDCQLVIGSAQQRVKQYDNDYFFTICNYEQVFRDILAIEQVKWDLIILDEGQRIKNWEAKTSRIVKGLQSRFALVLTGTPLENRLDELYSIISFIDDRRLGPAFRFFNQHRIIDESGKVLGYKNLAELRERLKPILLRRTRTSVMKQLPPRTTKIMRIAPTDEQLCMHGTNMKIVSSIVKKPYISEMDLLRLRKALLMCRMVADSTFLIDKQEPSYSSKLIEIDNLLERIANEENRKTIIFSEWTTMLNLIEPILKRYGLRFVRLDGSVLQKKRQQLVHQFQTDQDCKVFLATNAGATGLNLQAANTIINVDLPWNPAVLEQRIGRAHRMGQTQPVQVYIMVTEATIEENLLGTLAAKNDLANAALDIDSEIDAVDLAIGMDELKSRLEILLGAKPEAIFDESERTRQEQVTKNILQQKQISLAGGHLLGAAFNFLGEMLAQQEENNESQAMTKMFKQRLHECLEKDENGNFQLKVTLPDAAAIDSLASSLGRLLSTPRISS
ncbi:MAG: DEAD/DEAH box helicase, partial [Deltaproteobacteria bacterium]|nr:DEAD/DEAH box helicase [Deltaproteobacteria bacterium]